MFKQTSTLCKIRRNTILSSLMVSCCRHCVSLKQLPTLLPLQLQRARYSDVITLRFVTVITNVYVFLWKQFHVILYKTNTLSFCKFYICNFRKKKNSGHVHCVSF